MPIVAPCEAKTNTTPDFPMGWFSVARRMDLHLNLAAHVIEKYH